MYDLSFYLENNRCSSSGLMVSKGILNDVCFFFQKLSCKAIQKIPDSNYSEILLIFPKDLETFIYADL